MSSVDLPTPLAPWMDSSRASQCTRFIISLTISNEVLAINRSCFTNSVSIVMSLFCLQKYKSVGYNQHFSVKIVAYGQRFMIKTVGCGQHFLSKTVGYRQQYHVFEVYSKGGLQIRPNNTIRPNGTNSFLLFNNFPESRPSISKLHLHQIHPRWQTVQIKLKVGT